MKRANVPIAMWIGVALFGCVPADADTYPIVDTNQAFCYDDLVQINCPPAGSPFHGQDAQYVGAVLAYGTYARLEHRGFGDIDLLVFHCS